jgi:hypothetical protein
MRELVCISRPLPIIRGNYIVHAALTQAALDSRSTQIAQYEADAGGN